MFQIKLKNNVTFSCDKDTTILSAAINDGKVLEHSCLSARCRSCIVKVLEGSVVNLYDEFVLSTEEKENGYILSCNSMPLNDLTLDVEDLGNIALPNVKTFPAKIDSIDKISPSIIKVILRLPPSSDFTFIPGQYVNIIKGKIKRSYSIANKVREDYKLEFFVKKYEGGEMSKYWFDNAKLDDLLRIEGPLGTFFYRETNNLNLIFLATGTGIAPIKAILEQIRLDGESFSNKKIFIIWGGRNKDDLFWSPKATHGNMEFIPVISRDDSTWIGECGYVQDVLIRKGIDLSDSKVYACGSFDMISSARKLLINNGLPESDFYSDAFVSTN